MTTRQDARDTLTPLSFRILLALSDEDRHGYGILKEIEGSVPDEAAPATGTLYLALQRMLGDGLIQESKRREGRRRYYRLTPLGKTLAKEEASRLLSLVSRARDKRLLTPSLIESALRKRET